MNIEERERIEWLNYWIEDANENKKRIILLGDSVTREIRKRLNSFMGEEYAVDLIAMSYSVLDDMVVEELKHFFDRAPYCYDAIFYQMGAHHGYYLECIKSDDAVKRYADKTEEILKLLSQYSVRLIAVTPTYERSFDKEGKKVLNHNEEITKRNQIMQAVSNHLNITFFDLNKEIDYKKVRYSDWCHFYEECYEYISKAIVERFFPEIHCVVSNRVGTIQQLDVELEHFKERKIYIYGNGVRGNCMRMYLRKKGYVFGGFIVSDKYLDLFEDVLSINQINKEEALIIVTPTDMEIWRQLEERKYDYISLNSDIYTFLDADANNGAL